MPSLTKEQLAKLQALNIPYSTRDTHSGFWGKEYRFLTRRMAEQAAQAVFNERGTIISKWANNAFGFTIYN